MLQSFPLVRLAALDLDGTLLDSNGIWLDIDIEFLGRRGISPVPEDYTDYVTHHSAPDAAHVLAIIPT